MSAPVPTRNMAAPQRPTRQGSVFRRYSWDSLTDPEKAAVMDSVSIAGLRASVGVGAVLTITAFVTNARRGKPPLPALMRYGTVGFFSLVGAYAGFISAGPLYAERILSVPGSKLAEDLRIVAGDWEARAPMPRDEEQAPAGADSPPPPPIERRGAAPAGAGPASDAAATSATPGAGVQSWSSWLWGSKPQ